MTDAAFDYSWLDDPDRRPGTWLADASCFTFVRSMTPQAVLEAFGVADVRSIDLTGDDKAVDTLLEDHELDAAAYAGETGWTVVYQDNSFPGQLAEQLLGSAALDRGVVVFWNVNGVVEFSLWERGEQIVTFEWPDDRGGTQPDRLLAEMAQVGLDTGEPAFSRQLLALAEHVTGIHLDADFLARPVLAFSTPD